MKAGCLGVLIEVAVWVFSTVLVTLGAFMLVAGAVVFSPTLDAAVIFTVVVVPVGAYLLLRVGQDIWRELRGLTAKK
jgi:TRAP-type C4-dicarboxylate transport system permease small subunit